MLTAMQQRLRMGTCNTPKDLVHLIGVAEAESAGAARADISAALMSRDLIIGLADLAATCRHRCQLVPICILQA